MRREHVILVAGAIAVSGLVIYLFVAVNAAPAQARPAAPEVAHAEVAPSDDSDDSPPPAKPGKPDVEPRVDLGLEKRTPRSLGLGGVKHLTKARAERDLTDKDPERADPKMDSVMDEANKAYDSGDMEDAKAIALKVLANDPTNVRMLRIAVSTSCIDGDNAEAQKHYAQLPGPDREQMKTRCARYGVTFGDGQPSNPSIPARKGTPPLN